MPPVSRHRRCRQCRGRPCASPMARQGPVSRYRRCRPYTGGLPSRRTRFSYFLRLNRLETQKNALPTIVSRFADLRQQICRPTSADLPTFVSRFADLRQQQLESLFGTIELGLRFIKNRGWLRIVSITCGTNLVCTYSRFIPSLCLCVFSRLQEPFTITCS